MYEKAIANKDNRIIKFCRNIFDVYDKFEINLEKNFFFEI